MSSKQPKPGVRTNLNSGKNKIKKINKTASNVERTTPNPTAQKASQNLPKMQLSTNTNWAEETSSSILNLSITITSERTLAENNIIEIPDTVLSENSLTEEPEQIKTPTQQKKPPIKEEKKKKYKKQVNTKFSGIIEDIKDTISLSVDSMKIDYKRINEMQTEIQTSAKAMKSTIQSKADEVKIYTNNIKNELSELKKEINKINKNNKTKKRTQQSTSIREVSEPRKKNTPSTSSINEIKKASEFAAKTQSQEANTRNQKLSEAYISRDALQKNIASLKAQLNYASKERKEAIQNRITLKQEQLKETLILIEQILNNEDT